MSYPKCFRSKTTGRIVEFYDNRNGLVVQARTDELDDTFLGQVSRFEPCTNTENWEPCEDPRMPNELKIFQQFKEQQCIFAKSAV